MADIYAFGELVIELCADSSKVPTDKRQALGKVPWEPLQVLAHR